MLKRFLMLALAMMLLSPTLSRAAQNTGCSSTFQDDQRRLSSFYQESDTVFVIYDLWCDDLNGRPAPGEACFYNIARYNCAAGQTCELLEQVFNAISASAILVFNTNQVHVVADGIDVDCAGTTDKPYVYDWPWHTYSDPFGYSTKERYDFTTMNANCRLMRTDGLDLSGGGFYMRGSYELRVKDRVNPNGCSSAGGGKG
jgi:hypothetical protein